MHDLPLACGWPPKSVMQSAADCRAAGRPAGARRGPGRDLPLLTTESVVRTVTVVQHAARGRVGAGSHRGSSGLRWAAPPPRSLGPGRSHVRPPPGRRGVPAGVADPGVGRVRVHRRGAARFAGTVASDIQRSSAAEHVSHGAAGACGWRRHHGL